jgi:HK97 family phage portal protein
MAEMRSAAGAEIKVTEETALKLTVVYACVRIIAEQIASFPFPVYRRMDNGGRLRDKEHPVFDLLNITPNGEITAMQWREAMLGHTLTWGNGYSEIEFNRAGEPIALHLLPPNKIKVERSKSGKIIYKLDNNITPIPASNMLHWAGMGFDGLMGYSPIRLGKSAIALGMSTELFGSSFFNNGSKPGGVLVHPGTLSPQAVENLKNSIEAEHGGPGNFGKWMVLQEGMSIEQTGIPPEDAQFLATRTFQLQEITRLFRVPNHLVNEMSAST